jgi:hypothetical protein
MEKSVDLRGFLGGPSGDWWGGVVICEFALERPSDELLSWSAIKEVVVCCCLFGILLDRNL